MKHLLYSSVDFKENLKWVNEVKKHNESITDIQHRAKKNDNLTFYTTIVFYKKDLV